LKVTWSSCSSVARSGIETGQRRRPCHPAYGRLSAGRACIRAASEVEAGAALLQTLGGHSVDVPFPEDDVIMAADLNFVPVLGVE